jgi:zinc finger-like protein
MRAYFGMLDALLARDEGTLPAELAARTQAVACDDCGGTGDAPFHFVYHKCGGCGSYNTRLL